jgi:hypothetical protein
MLPEQGGHIIDTDGRDGYFFLMDSFHQEMGVDQENFHA